MTAALLHLHNRTRPPTPDVPTVVFSAAAPCGCEVTWRATMPHNPVPDECANPACLAGLSVRIGAATPHSEAPHGLASAGASNQPTRLTERTS